MTDPYSSPQPLPSGQWRVSDADRAPINERLRHAVDEGRLNLVEYDQRLQQVDRAQTLDELDRVVFDLPAPVEAIIAQIGEIAVTTTTVNTPMGPIRLRGSAWAVQDQWQTEQKIPSWAIVLAILGFFCVGPFSLLFLLAKESRYSGHVQVGVTNGPRQYTAYLPVQSHAMVHYVHQQVNYVRSVAAR